MDDVRGGRSMRTSEGHSARRAVWTDGSAAFYIEEYSHIPDQGVSGG